MSEKIYGWLLRLYPAHFRRAYGEEALQLFRDRSRQERGLLQTLRLWLDLLGDLAISVPRQYRRTPPAFASAAVWHHPDGTPSFRVLASQSPGLGALFLGGIVSLAAAGGSIPIARMASHRAWMPGGSARRSGYERWPGREPLQKPGDLIERMLARRARAAGKAEAGVPQMRPMLAQVVLAPTASAGEQQPAQEGGRVISPAPAGDVSADAGERRRIVHAVVENLKKHYVDSGTAQEMGEALLTHERAGDYRGAEDGTSFAALLTKQLREVSHDLHLEVVYSRRPLPAHSNGPSPERMAAYRNAMEANHCTFEKVEMLPHRIGYLKLNSFPEPSICGTAAKAAMASLNGAEAMIFDLRDNRGGYPGMVMLLASYLFDHPEYMYSPRETTERCWTQSPVVGSKLADKPVYVLTSARTYSGAEHFSYDLKMLKRATLVGEKTAGATDVAVFHRMDEHFGIAIREAKAINPFAEPDWAAAGVQPDIRVRAADALATAEKLARAKVRKK